MKRLEWLDSNFLAAVNAFLAVPGVRSNPELSALLQAIRQETLQLVSSSLLKGRRMNRVCENCSWTGLPALIAVDVLWATCLQCST